MKYVQQCNNVYRQINYVYNIVRIYKVKLNTRKNAIFYKAKRITCATME